MPKNDRTGNSFETTGSRSSRSGGPKRQASTSTSSRGGGRLQLPHGEADIEALRSVTREWLVPRLVEKFLRVHGRELKHSRNLANRLRLSLPGEGSLLSEGTVSKEIRPQVKKKNPYRGLK
jgi:hypothetical protein